MLVQPRKPRLPSVRASCSSYWLRARCPHWEESGAPSSPDLNLLHYHVRGAMLKNYSKLQPKRKTTTGLKVAPQIVWEKLPQEHNQQDGGELHRALDCLAVRGCRWRSLWASPITLSISKSASLSLANITALFKATNRLLANTTRNGSDWLKRNSIRYILTKLGDKLHVHIQCKL